jgi:hypothetical protein
MINSVRAIGSEERFEVRREIGVCGFGATRRLGQCSVQWRVSIEMMREQDIRRKFYRYLVLLMHYYVSAWRCSIELSTRMMISSTNTSYSMRPRIWDCGKISGGRPPIGKKQKEDDGARGFEEFLILCRKPNPTSDGRDYSCKRFHANRFATGVANVANSTQALSSRDRYFLLPRFPLTLHASMGKLDRRKNQHSLIAGAGPLTLSSSICVGHWEYAYSFRSCSAWIGRLDSRHDLPRPCLASSRPRVLKFLACSSPRATKRLLLELRLSS